jgi:hypothetical protein
LFKTQRRKCPHSLHNLHKVRADHPIRSTLIGR